MKILPEQSGLWHDLSVSLYLQSQEIFSSGGLEDVPAGKTLLQKAKQAARKTISLAPKDWSHWNLLGVIVCCKHDENLPLAQHCFIESIHCESSNAVAWSNLGSLYLSQSEIQLAHDAFKCAQSVDPTYMACWVGQALIAEVVGHEEAMDLFRHTTELGVHLESAVGYGQWVLNILGDPEKRGSEMYNYCIKQMAAVPAACDALTRYTRRVKTDAMAFNMLGLLSEHQKHWQSAVDAFEKAIELLNVKGDEKKLNDVRLNLARTYVSSGKYESAINIYNCSEISESAEHMCLFGLALYRIDNLVESFKVLEEALEHVSSDKHKSQVHAALGMVAYKFNDLEGAKSQLFSSFQTSSPSSQGLLALCALGLLLQDATLTSAVLEELAKVEDDRQLHNIALLHLYRFTCSNDSAGGEAYMREILEKYPGDSELWLLLAKHILQNCPDQGTASAECCSTSASLSSDTSRLCDIDLLQCSAQMLVGQHSRRNTRMNAVKSAQKAFHLNPGSMAALGTLACAVHAEAVLTSSLAERLDLLQVSHGLLSVLIDKHAKHQVKIWCLQLSVINRILAQDFELAKTQCKDLSQSGDETPLNKLLQDTLTSNIDADSTDLSFIAAIGFLTHQEKYSEAAGKINEFLDNKGNDDLNPALYKNVLERKAFILYKRLLQKDDDDKNKEHLDSMVQTIKDKNISSSIINILQAMLTQDNKRLSKHHFATALDCVEASTDVGYTSSMARQGLVTLLWDSTKESDQKLIQVCSFVCL